jgi:hypothetical protein
VTQPVLEHGAHTGQGHADRDEHRPPGHAGVSTIGETPEATDPDAPNRLSEVIADDPVPHDAAP